MAPGEGALSARTVLEVADGLRWSDHRLGLSLAEHALRLAGDDTGARAAAQRSVIRSLAEADRFEEVVSRATPLLEDAAVRQDRDDLAGLLVELAAAAMGFGDDGIATRLVAPVGPGEELPNRTTVHAALVRARLAGTTGDVAGADRAAQEAETALRQTGEPDAGLARRDLARARAAARSRSGDPATALPLVSGVESSDPDADPDGGRRSLLAAADHVDLLLDLGRPDEALERGRAALPTTITPPLVRPAARVRLALAERVHLARGAHDEARTLARSAAEQLEDAGHDADAARAWEVVASAAERGGDLAAALTAVRHGHALESRARDRRDPALRALATLAASAPELPPRPTPTPAPEPTPTPTPTAPALGPGPTSTSEAESVVPDAQPAVGDGPGGEVDGTDAPVRRRSHRRQGADGASRPPGTESVPETLARLLGTNGAAPAPGAGTTASADAGERVEAGGLGGAEERATGVPEGGPDAASPPATPSWIRGPGGGDDEVPEPPAEGRADTGSRPTFDAFSTAPRRRDVVPAGADRFGPGTEPSPEEFPHIDPADPLGSVNSGGGLGRPLDGAAEVGRDTPPRAEPDRGAGPTTSARGSSPVLPTGRADEARRDGVPPGVVPGSPPPRREEREVPAPHRSTSTPLAGSPPVSRYEPGGAGRAEFDEELALTLAGLLAEYGAPDQPPAQPQHDVRSPGVEVPSARRHVSGSMPLPTTDQRFAARPPEAPDRAAPPPDAGAGGRAPRGENGARLANLLAEAMDAFRHTGPEESGWAPGDPSQGHGDPRPGEGAPARGNGDGGLSAPGRGRPDGTRGPGIGTRRG